jgi:trans-aconitate methyltransferase
MDTIASFDRAAESYATFAAPQAALAAALAAWIAPVERRGRALEFGAGTGLLTERLQPWAGPYLATDASAAMLQRGQSRCPFVDWQLHDARNPAGLGPADWIFACGLLQWLGEPAITFRRWHAEIALGGRLAVGILLPGTFAELESLLPEASPVRWRSTPEWENLLRQAGFRLDRAETWEHLSLHPSALEFLRAVHAMGLAPRRTVGPGRLRIALRAYDRRFAGPAGVRATWRAWLARATAV